MVTMIFGNNKHFSSIIVIICLQSSLIDGFPTAQDVNERQVLSEIDLVKNYDHLSRNAVTRDTIVSDRRGMGAMEGMRPMSAKNKLVSINNGKDFNIPIDDNVMSRPIGTYQYIDADGDLHIVNYINDPNGLRILNDYKPYASLNSKNKSKTIGSNDPKSKVRNNEKVYPKHNALDETLEKTSNINYDEYEFTFMSQEINKSMDKSNNKINDLNSSASNDKNADRLSLNSEEKSTKVMAIGDNDYSNDKVVNKLTQLMNSMPLPKPFSLPIISEPQPMHQRPEPINDNWRGPPIPLSPFHGRPVPHLNPNFAFHPINYF